MGDIKKKNSVFSRSDHTANDLKRNTAIQEEYPTQSLARWRSATFWSSKQINVKYFRRRYLSKSAYNTAQWPRTKARKALKEKHTFHARENTWELANATEHQNMPTGSRRCIDSTDPARINKKRQQKSTVRIHAR